VDLNSETEKRVLTISKKRLDDLFQQFSRRKILVIGDLMLDHYLWGRALRISPEAPVPVVDVEREEYRLGGAANVAFNVVSLGAEVLMVGVAGNDASESTMRKLFQRHGLSPNGLIIDKKRPTTLKTRVIAHDQHVVRIDRELRHDIGQLAQKRLLDFLEDQIECVDGVILEDYNKGLLTSGVIRSVITMARKYEKLILVDPKFDHFFDYRNVTLFKPNRHEVASRLGMRIESDHDLERAGNKLLEKLACRALLITLGDEGMALFQQDQPWLKIPTRARHVHDVSGAGDTVIATLTVAMTSTASLEEAATIANYAAGLVCGEVGIVPVDRQALLTALCQV